MSVVKPSSSSSIVPSVWSSGERDVNGLRAGGEGSDNQEWRGRAATDEGGGGASPARWTAQTPGQKLRP